MAKPPRSDRGTWRRPPFNWRWPGALLAGHAGIGGSEVLEGDRHAEGIDNSYVSRMVNLTTLAPDIVAAILDDALPNHITLFDLAVDPPALWDEQRSRLTVRD